MNKNYNPCAIIPVYNHALTTELVVKDLAHKNLPVFIVDDGGTPEVNKILHDITTRYEKCFLITLDVNSGKGAAVMAGFKEAFKSGYTHGLQVDADGQHDLKNIDIFVEEARKKPEDLIAGYPEYDSSVPLARLNGRKLTTACIALETLSRDIVDGMCGFRLYPLESVMKLMEKTKIKSRMDFDIDIIVRLHWMGLSIKFLPVKVIYPENGISNFRVFIDNVAISKIHTILIIGMLFRFPLILYRNKHRESHWSVKKEKSSSVWLLKLIYNIYILLGAKFFRFFLHGITGFFYIFSPSTRKVSKSYLLKVFKKNNIPKNPTGKNVYKHIYSFANLLVEKLDAWAGGTAYGDLVHATKDIELITSELSEGRGAVIICSHLGNIEMLRAIANLETGKNLPDFKIHSVVDIDVSENYNKLMEKINPDSKVRLINASTIDASTIIHLQHKIEQGDLVVIAGDRTAKNNRSKNYEIEFLGENAYFPQGSFMLASLLESPIYFMFALRENDNDFNSAYEFHVYKSEFNVVTNRKERKDRFEKVAREYVSHIENLCLIHPYQWFNFFDFWKK